MDIQEVYELVKRNAAPMFIGIAVDVIGGYNLFHWQWWAIVVPTIILYGWRSQK